MNLTDRAIKHYSHQYNDSFGGDANHKGKHFLAALSRQHSPAQRKQKQEKMPMCCRKIAYNAHPLPSASH